MKFLSLVILSGFLTVSCAHKKGDCKDGHCEKKEAKSCCKMTKEQCKDHCDKKKEEKKQ